MKILLTLAALCLISLQVHAQASPRNTYQVQLTVWNQTNQLAVLTCIPTKGVTINQLRFNIGVNESPAIFLTANHYGKLLQCNMQGSHASFVYSVITPDKENVEIAKVPKDQPTFYYQPYYAGALIYK